MAPGTSMKLNRIITKECFISIITFRRHHFRLELLDGLFEIASVPYLFQQHKDYVKNFVKAYPDTIDQKMTDFTNGPGGAYWKKAPCDTPRTSSNQAASEI